MDIVKPVPRICPRSEDEDVICECALRQKKSILLPDIASGLYIKVRPVAIYDPETG